MPDYAAAIKKIREENPDMQDISIDPVGPVGNFLQRGADASTSPWTGSISYNPTTLQNVSQPELENTLTHEMVHARQVQQTPYLSRFTGVLRSLIPGADYAYQERPRELEAYQAERDRSLREGYSLPDPQTGGRDIELPPLSPRRKILSMFTNDRTPEQ